MLHLSKDIMFIALVDEDGKVLSAICHSKLPSCAGSLPFEGDFEGASQVIYRTYVEPEWSLKVVDGKIFAPDIKELHGQPAHLVDTGADDGVFYEEVDGETLERETVIIVTPHNISSISYPEFEQYCAALRRAFSMYNTAFS